METIKITIRNKVQKEGIEKILPSITDNIAKAINCGNTKIVFELTNKPIIEVLEYKPYPEKEPYIQLELDL